MWLPLRGEEEVVFDLCKYDWSLSPWFPRLCATVAHKRWNHPDKRGGRETLFARKAQFHLANALPLTERVILAPLMRAPEGSCLLIATPFGTICYSSPTTLIEPHMPAESALITGASSGIGQELAELFARDKCPLILVARRQDKLQELADRLSQTYGIQTLVIACDLSKPLAAQTLFDAVTAAGWSVDFLVNNAGFGGMGYFEEIPQSEMSDMLQVNVLALTQLTRMFIPGMLAKKRGQILNVASTAAFQPGPNAAVYYASKAYVRYFSEGLQTELSGTGVTVTCIAPGPTRTNFGEVARMGETPIFRLNSMAVEPVALAAYNGMRSGKTLVVPGIFNKLLQFSSKMSHWGIVKQVMKRVMQPLPPRQK
jgi:uncharacterized protein